MGQLLDGLAVAKAIRLEIKDVVESMVAKGQRVPGLAVVIVGDDPASQTYVASKIKQSQALGFYSQAVSLPADTTEETLLAHIQSLNNNPCIDGILVQLPLPKHIHEKKIINALDPAKDVDGLHPLNVGYMECGQTQFVPCTPKGIMTLLRRYNISLAGKCALVIGRSRLVGKPIASLLTQANATVTIAHSQTQDLQGLITRADIVVVAMGQREFVKADWISDKQIIIDVGIHHVDGVLFGDVERAAYTKAAYATPVLKGVGPMTLASLFENTLEAYQRGTQHD